MKTLGLVIFSAISPHEQLDELNMRLDEVERTKKEGEETRRLKEIKIREEAKRKAIQDEQIR